MRLECWLGIQGSGDFFLCHHAADAVARPSEKMAAATRLGGGLYPGLDLHLAIDTAFLVHTYTYIYIRGVGSRAWHGKAKECSECVERH